MKLSEFFQHDFKNGEFNLFDKNGKLVYREFPPDKKDPDGFWAKYIKREDGLCSYMEFSNGYWAKHEYNEAGQEVSKKCSDGYWWIQEYDSDGNETVCTCSDDKYSEMEVCISDFDEICQKNIKDYKKGTVRDMFIELNRIIENYEYRCEV